LYRRRFANFLLEIFFEEIRFIFHYQKFQEKKYFIGNKVPKCFMAQCRVVQGHCCFRGQRVRISSTYSILWPFSYIRPFLYFDPPTLLRPKPYFDFFGQTLVRPKLYFDLYFSTNKMSRFDKRSKYRGPSKRVELKSSK